MKKTRKIILWCILILLSAGVICVILADMVLWADIDHFGGITYRIEEVDGRQAYCFYTVKNNFRGIKGWRGELVSIDYENSLGYYKSYVTVSYQLIDDGTRKQGPIMTVGLDGNPHNTPNWNINNLAGTDTERGHIVLKERVCEIIYRNPDGSEVSIWKLEIPE